MSAVSPELSPVSQHILLALSVIPSLSSAHPNFRQISIFFFSKTSASSEARVYRTMRLLIYLNAASCPFTRGFMNAADLIVGPLWPLNDIPRRKVSRVYARTSEYSFAHSLIRNSSREASGFLYIGGCDIFHESRVDCDIDCCGTMRCVKPSRSIFYNCHFNDLSELFVFLRCEKSRCHLDCRFFPCVPYIEHVFYI